MRDFIRELLDGGEAALEKLIGQTETFELEFKTKEQASNHKLSKIDKKNLGKTLSGFSNADGGVVIFGIETEQRDHQDVARKLRPIADIQRFKSEVDGRFGELLRPANPSIESHTIPCATGSNSGYLLIDIGESEFRPHMSMAPDHQKYFRRSVEGTLIMDHSLIRDLMMAPREAHIKPKWRIWGGSTQGATGKRIVDIRLDLYLENVGFAMAAMPFARVWMNPKLQQKNVNSAAPSSPRPDGSVAFYGTRDAVVHPQDEVLFGGYAITMTVESDAFKKAVECEDWTGAVAPEIWGFGRSYDVRTSSLQQEFEAIEITVSFGAENARKQEKTFHLAKSYLTKLALDQALGAFRITQSEKEALAQALDAIETHFGAIDEKPATY